MAAGWTDPANLIHLAVAAGTVGTFVVAVVGVTLARHAVFEITDAYLAGYEVDQEDVAKAGSGTRGGAADMGVVERLPRGPFLFQQLFFARDGDPHLVVRGHATLPAVQLLDELPAAEFGATLERLRVLPAEYDVAPFVRSLKRH